jgi:hypothetical protein
LTVNRITVAEAVRSWSDNWTVRAPFRSLRDAERADAEIMRRLVSAKAAGMSPAKRAALLVRTIDRR